MNIDALILCGGAGRRMGGVDKGWADWRGQPLIHAMLGVVRRQSLPARQIWISANRELERYRALPGITGVVTDATPGFPGPLAGIDAAFATSHADWLWVLPCDTPNLPDDTLQQLQEASHGVDLIVAAIADGEGWHMQPTICLAHRRSWPVLQQHWQQGHRALWRWQQAVPHRQVQFADARAFDNLNTPDSLTAAPQQDTP